MVQLIKEFPFTFLLALVGLAVGGLIIPEQNIFQNYDFSGIGVNPVEFFTSYFSNTFNFELESLFFGVVFAMLLGLIGFVIDFSRKED